MHSPDLFLTKGTAGIGKALAISLLQRGAEVTVVGRRQPDESLAKAKFIAKDLTLMRSAQALAEEIVNQKTSQPLDLLIMTNGILSTPERNVTPEGLELDLAVSYLSRLAFLKQLLSAENGRFAPKRIFLMGYPGKTNRVPLDDFNSEQSYSAITTHMRTVVGNEALVTYSEALSPSSVVFGLNPGLIRTEIRDNYLGKGTWLSWAVEGVVGMLFPTAEQYAEQVLIQLMADPELDAKSKTLFDSDGTVLPPNPFLVEPGNYERVIQESDALVDKALKVKLNEKT